MPELPEVDRVRTTLGPHVIGRTITRVHVLRADIITGHASEADLLHRQAIIDILRHGKQLALVSESGQCVCVHLGMSGSLQHHPVNIAPETIFARKHVHILWRLDDGSHMSFRDPRRFGGLWTFATLEHLQDARWRCLGPDALAMTPKALHKAIAGSRRPLKALLLDQTIVAGLGNIYVDEALYAARLHPQRPACELTPSDCQQIVRCFKAILKRAIASGGSTIRSYTDGLGDSGTFQRTLQVYGRGGLPCFACEHPLSSLPVIGRTTTFCQYCQRG